MYLQYVEYKYKKWIVGLGQTTINAVHYCEHYQWNMLRLEITHGVQTSAKNHPIIKTNVFYIFRRLHFRQNALAITVQPSQNEHSTSNSDTDEWQKILAPNPNWDRPQIGCIYYFLLASKISAKLILNFFSHPATQTNQPTKKRNKQTNKQTNWGKTTSLAKVTVHNAVQELAVR